MRILKCSRSKVHPGSDTYALCWYADNWDRSAGKDKGRRLIVVTLFLNKLAPATLTADPHMKPCETQ